MTRSARLLSANDASFASLPPAPTFDFQAAVADPEMPSALPLAVSDPLPQLRAFSALTFSRFLVSAVRQVRAGATRSPGTRVRPRPHWGSSWPSSSRAARPSRSSYARLASGRAPAIRIHCSGRSVHTSPWPSSARRPGPDCAGAIRRCCRSTRRGTGRAARGKRTNRRPARSTHSWATACSASGSRAAPGRGGCRRSLLSAGTSESTTSTRP